LGSLGVAHLGATDRLPGVGLLPGAHSPAQGTLGRAGIADSIVRRPTVRTNAELGGFQQLVIVGAALAGLAWGATGVVALLDPGPDPGPVGSSSFFLIEGGHALSETGMFLALLGLWRSQRSRLGRPAKVAFGLAATATVVLAALTYLVVGAAALGVVLDAPAEGQSVPAPLVALASVLFLFTLVGILVGYIGSGVATIRTGVWPRLVGWPLIAHPFLIAANLVIYPVGIVIGAVWLGLAWVARQGQSRP